MKICVVGLGLIGGSICMALKKSGRTVYGYNRSQQAVNYALKNGIIDGVAQDFSNFDVLFIALPPQNAISFIDETAFKTGAVVADICGVKRAVYASVKSKVRNFYYVGAHPMAGKEVSGITNADANLFCGASMVLCRERDTEETAFKTVKLLTRDMGFKRIVECTSEIHDTKIAYTSQLAHVVSNSYVKNGEIESCLGFTGGSFQDMTRIAGVDENVWASLYLLNKDNLSNDIQTLINSLTEFKNLLDAGDIESLIENLKIGRRTFEDGKSNSFTGKDIKVYELY